jgi:hypothetical protein
MAWPYHEEPISETEHQHIRNASGVLYELCEKARGTPDEDRVSEEHDAMMRLRRRNEQVEESNKDLVAALKALTASVFVAEGDETPELSTAIRMTVDAINKAQGRS